MWIIKFTNETCIKILSQYFWLWWPQSLTCGRMRELLVGLGSNICSLNRLLKWTLAELGFLIQLQGENFYLTLIIYIFFHKRHFSWDVRYPNFGSVLVKILRQTKGRKKCSTQSYGSRRRPKWRQRVISIIFSTILRALTFIL